MHNHDEILETRYSYLREYNNSPSAAIHREAADVSAAADRVTGAGVSASQPKSKHVLHLSVAAIYDQVPESVKEWRATGSLPQPRSLTGRNLSPDDYKDTVGLPSLRA